jgi:hypothetical protein
LSYCFTVPEKSQLIVYNNNCHYQLHLYHVSYTLFSAKQYGTTQAIIRQDACMHTHLLALREAKRIRVWDYRTQWKEGSREGQSKLKTKQKTNRQTSQKVKQKTREKRRGSSSKSERTRV